MMRYNPSESKLTAKYFRSELETIKGKTPQGAGAVPQEIRDELAELIRKSSQWSSIKKSGTAALPRGDVTTACNALLGDLREASIHVVELGELESFAKTIGSHGPKWANSALERDLGSDPEFHSAREFCSGSNRGSRILYSQ